MYVDENGEFIITALIVGAIIGAYIGGHKPMVPITLLNGTLTMLILG